jgi:hypothetical protein
MNAVPTYFAWMERREQRAVIERLAKSGLSNRTISSLTNFSIDQIRQILAERIPIEVNS